MIAVMTAVGAGGIVVGLWLHLHVRRQRRLEALEHTRKSRSARAYLEHSLRPARSLRILGPIGLPAARSRRS